MNAMQVLFDLHSNGNIFTLELHNKNGAFDATLTPIDHIYHNPTFTGTDEDNADSAICSVVEQYDSYINGLYACPKCKKRHHIDTEATWCCVK